MNRYRIEWYDKVIGGVVRGTWTKNKAVVDATVAHLNAKYPDVSHRCASEFPEGPPPLRLTFAIDHPGETAAGISSFTDTVTVEVESGDPVGDEGEFAEFIRTALREWYDGAKVELNGGKV